MKPWVEALSALISQSGPDQPHLGLPTPTTPWAFLKLSLGLLVPSWAVPLLVQVHLLSQSSSCGLTFRPELQICLIPMILLYDLDSWLDLATISRAVLHALLGYCGMHPGRSGPCPARHGMPSAPGCPPLREQCCCGCSLTHWTETTSPNKEGGMRPGVEHTVREMQEVILYAFSLPFLKNALIVYLAAFPQDKAGKPLSLLVYLENT